jgi:hypothetical protein
MERTSLLLPRMQLGCCYGLVVCASSIVAHMQAEKNHAELI